LNVKVAVSATSGSLNAQIDPRFGRCSYFVIVDTDTMHVDTLQNSSQSAPSGAGIAAAQTVANHGVHAVLTGNVGPNAHQVLSAAGIDIRTGAVGTVKDAVDQFMRGQLPQTTTPTTPMGVGTGGGFGMGMGRGRGGGRGMGRSRGMGMQPGRGTVAPSGTPGTPPTPMTSPPPMSKDEEIRMLDTQMTTLQQQLDQIKKRLKELEANK
jgi:predicted Fe-Mo cluster-binding NifX family protein